MIKGNCSNPDCAAPIACHLGHDNITDCGSWISNSATSLPTVTKKEKPTKKSQLTWSGEPLKVEELGTITPRNFPIIIGIIGKADAGKTTYLAMLYTLLLRGESFHNYRFAGSKTILGWEELYHKLKVYKNKVVFPEPTPLSYNRLHHLALRGSNDKLYDLLLSDASGEVFSRWSQNRDDANAENARWIYNRSNAFILFIDCDDLVKRKNQAKTEIVDMAEMLKYELRNRPIIAVWSKADMKPQVHPAIAKSLSEELVNMFPKYTEIEISNFSTEDPDELVHANNLRVIDWIFDQLDKPENINLSVGTVVSGDLFLNFKGNE